MQQIADQHALYGMILHLRLKPEVRVKTAKVKKFLNVSGFFFSPRRILLVEDIEISRVSFIRTHLCIGF